MRRALLALALLLALATSGCLMGPNYQRPKIDVPTAYHGPDRTPTADSLAALGNATWWTVYEDPQLQKLIRIALEQNFDLRIAANRVLQARETVRLARSNQYPTVTGGLNVSGERAPAGPGSVTYYNIPEVGLSASWDIDFWGKYRRLTEAARAELVQTEWARRAVVDGLVSDVAAAYFELRTLDLQLEISRRTLASRQSSVDLTRTLVDGGAAPLSDQRQAEQLVETAATSIPGYERQIAQQENAINVLLGRNPGVTIDRGLSVVEQPQPATPPVGIPSALLERRPDIAEAEQSLIAANARIGAARANFFPDISLTATGGVASTALTTLFNGGARAWTYTASAMEPIFNKGRLDANYRLAQEQRDQAVLVYQQTIERAFREVSDALIGYQKYREARVHQERLLAASKDSAELSRTRYQGGATSYLEVLTNDTNAFSAEIGLAAAILSERLSLVQLYNVLGGGWTP